MDNPVEDALGQPEAEETHVEAPAEETPAPEPPVAAPGSSVAKASEDRQVPISAMLVEREKRQAAEARAKALEARMAAERPPAPPPEPGHELATQRYADNLRFSRRFAEREYGKEVIAEVHDWAQAKCDADPHFNASMRSSDDPYEAAYQAYHRDQIAAKVTPGRLAAFEAWEAAQAEAQAAQPSPSPQPGAVKPPASLANVPGTGLRGKPSQEEGEGEAFKALFS